MSIPTNACRDCVAWRPLGDPASPPVGWRAGRWRGPHVSSMTPVTMQKKRRVFLVDDHPLVVEWLGNLIGQQSDLVVCGQAGTKSQALERVPKASPGVVIVDISLELDSGIQLIRELKGNLPSLIVLVLSMHDELLYGERALRAGAAGYVMKREATRKILEAIRCVLTGKIYLSPELTS